HMLKHGAEQRRLAAELARSAPPDPFKLVGLDPARATVMGHEFCCEVVETGAGCDNLKVGDVVVSVPVAFDPDGLHAVGYSSRYPGGYAEAMVLNDVTGLRVPAGLSPQLAALTEPFAVGIHAVAKSRIQTGDAALVLGCGPVGLAVIGALRLKGIGPIVAADFSPARRALAVHLGADEVVDPAETTAIEAWLRIDGVRPLVVFEAVGVPGMIDAAMRMVPRGSRIVVVGACMQEDRIQPMAGIWRELSVQFVLGYEPDEFAQSLQAIADGEIDLAPIVTGHVDLDGVPGAFDDLARPDVHAKILIEP
ncbi:MAG TPA: zinc-binding dehydrogenase, partial [Acidimicrobiales bacterium]|nr:zinc-binding dehydrogenase [Acidimicrobiales bacterium]